ncbi:unnamed protein product [Caenorhabditis bovis]|uniref:Uncharacterized protein n=1 Tax=Caenorhabditis bovis TaxID=2654633 RepID=A0A8S1EI94_9PELO|nr:unnamed protein product [Caenorhabditis bovis]
MSTESPKGDCLVARAVPLMDPAEQLSQHLEKLRIEEANRRKNLKYEAVNSVSPADFVTLQSIRSSALARKTNTTSKLSRNGPALLGDLLNTHAIKGDKKQTKSAGEKNEKTTTTDENSNERNDEKNIEGGRKRDSKKDIKEKRAEEIDSDLLSRGPVRHVRPSPPTHPYHYGQIPYGTAPQTEITDISMYIGYGNGYECGSTWNYNLLNGSHSASTTPDTVSSEGYNSSSPSQDSPKATRQDLIEKLQSTDFLSDDNELPESLQDFILQYSNQYTKEEGSRIRPPSTDSGVSSPMSARYAPYDSPQIPQGTSSSGPNTPSQTRLSPRSSDGNTAKARLHALIKEKDLASGFHWAVTCATASSQLSRDNDGDTPLHIVAAHMDLAKIYALCETLRKTKKDNENPFDVTNKYNETPLYIAAVQGNVEVVEYLLELGADPNAYTTRGERTTALHQVAIRGNMEMLNTLINSRGIRLNDMNGRGETTVLHAVRMNGIVDEHSGEPLDTREVIGQLLRAGADPSIAENITGKTIVHYAVNRMDVDMLDYLKSLVDDDVFTELANRADFHGDTAVDILCSSLPSEPTDPKVRQEVYIRLLASGAIGNMSRA